MQGLSWKIGNVEIHQIIELDNAGDIIQESIKKAQSKDIKKISWLIPDFADSEGNLKAHVQSFLIKSNGKNILVDTCNGNEKELVDVPTWGNLQTNFLEKLSNLGIKPEYIDYVICTHLHFDHVGWNTTLKEDKWVPTFPNAKYLFAKEEFEYWKQMPEKEIEDDRQGIRDSVLPIINVGLTALIETNHTVDTNVYFIPTPGHTPHHISVVIESERNKAIISGDFVHHPCQIAHPDWDTIADTYPEQGIETRKKLLNEIADTETELLGSHFSNPVSGKIRSDDDSYKFETDRA